MPTLPSENVEPPRRYSFDCIANARPFTAEPHLFAAPLVQERDGGWAFVGFRNREALGDLTFEISDPIRVRLDDDGAGLATRD